MKRKLVSPDDPVLLRIAESIPPEKIVSHEIQKLIDEMLEVAQGNRKDKKKMTVVGLAAPQVGISKRIIAVDKGADGKGELQGLTVYINPETTWMSKEEAEWYEGCWSTDRVCGIVSRPVSIKVKAYTRDGTSTEEEHHGYTARIFQHEIDHLDGKEFVTHIIDDNKLHWVPVDDFYEYRNNEGWKHWKQLCPREKWEKIKGITK